MERQGSRRNPGSRRDAGCRDAIDNQSTVSRARKEAPNADALGERKGRDGKVYRLPAREAEPNHNAIEERKR